MPNPVVRLTLAASAAAVVAVAVGVSPAAAAVPAGCAPDAWEPDGDFGFSRSIAAPVPVGGSVTRAICQAPNPFPREIAGQDYDFFRFTATGGKAYVGELANVGAAVAGTLQIGGLYRVEADGSGTPINASTPANGRFTTDVLPAGEYGFLAYSAKNQVYPDNTLDIATISGPGGAYGVKVSESAAVVPAVTSVTLSSRTVKYGRSVSGTITMSGPAPQPMNLFSDSTSRLTANPSVASLQTGQRTATFTVQTTSLRPARDTQVTISYSTVTGAAKSVVLTVQR